MSDMMDDRCIKSTKESLGKLFNLLSLVPISDEILKNLRSAHIYLISLLDEEGKLLCEIDYDGKKRTYHSLLDEAEQHIESAYLFWGATRITTQIPQWHKIYNHAGQAEKILFRIGTKERLILMDGGFFDHMVTTKHTPSNIPGAIGAND